MAPDVEGLQLYAYVGEDEFGSGTVGLKQAVTPAGCVPLVVTAGDLGKLERSYVVEQLQSQADRFQKTIRLVRFVAVEEVLTITPGV